jgi:radical SAM enzyme (TIGR01210 family)
MRPHVNATLPYTVYSRGGYVQIWINTPACRYSILGKCSICDYWDGEFSGESIKLICEFIESHGSEYTTLLINTCGSCFCEEELSFDSLFHIATSIANTTIRRVIFESHLIYVKLDILKKLGEVLKGKAVVIEYGQESTSPQVLKFCLNKPSMLREYETVDSIHETGFQVYANVILGAPFLTVDQRIEDAVNSIHSLLVTSIDGVVLFPINIKPYTLVKFLYDNGYYKRVNAIEIVKALDCFSQRELERIELAWFEPEREAQAAYTERGLSPFYCEQCGERILRGLNNYCAMEDGDSRRNCIKELCDIACSCQESAYKDDYPDAEKCYRFLEETFQEGEVYVTN